MRKNHKVIVVIICCLCAIIGIWRINAANAPLTANNEGFNPLPSTTSKPTSAPDQVTQPASSQSSQHDDKIRVYVCGQVKKPSVMTISAESTAYDAVQLAGGMTAQADANRINLAAKLSDGQQLYVPAKGEATSSMIAEDSVTAPSAQTSRSTKSSASGSSMVNVNTASLSDLDSLPGVGPVIAQRIIDYRSQNGQFSSPEELLDVKGIGPKKLADMKPYLQF